MSQNLHSRRKGGRRHGRGVFAGLFLASVGLLTTAGVYAALTGVATGSESVSSGTLNLTLSADVGAGFSNFVAQDGPRRHRQRYVNVNNTGTLATAAGMTLWVAGSPVNALTNGTAPGEGLTVTATQCSVAWTLATGVCLGTTTPILATGQISTFNTAGTAVNLSNVPSLAASVGQLAHVQVSLGLVATEVSTNGVAPTPTVQGLTTTLTYTFTEQQRTGIATNQ